MSRTVIAFVCFATLATLATAACSGGEIAVGESDQQLQTRKNGSATGDGKTCSWDDTVASNTSSGTETTTSSGNGPYVVGDNFKDLGNCNDCSCTSRGIVCTTRDCGGSSSGNAGPQRCTEEAKVCPDGSSVGRTAPNCEFAPCPQACTEEAKQCPDGTSVVRTGPNCEFTPCPQGCAKDLKKCLDGTSVGRTGPNCEFAACPKQCPADAKQCPDGSFVGRTGPNCEFAPCP